MVAERLPCEDVDVSILAQPLSFNSGKSARNRIFKSAMTEMLSSFCPDTPAEHGLPSETVLTMYEKWGNGGFGIVLTGNIAVDPLHLESAGNVIIARENEGPKRDELLRRFAKNCKADGALALAQLTHAGRQTAENVNLHPRSCSDVQLEGRRRNFSFGKPIPYTEEEIRTDVVERFAYAAVEAYKAGFDGIELMGAHGYLLAQFMSPTTNKRTDSYGGTPENRVRVVLEIYDAIRKRIPASAQFIVGLKMNSVEFQEGGLSMEDAKTMCQLLEDRGYDFVEMSGGTYEKLVFAHVRDSTKAREAYFLEFTDQLRPVFQKTRMVVTGGFRTAKWMAAVIEDGKCDAVGLGRPVAAEPDLPKKILRYGVLGSTAAKIDQNTTSR
ncbi:unnamed protein product, partial [Mesorhabditis spiculigera]